MAKNSVLIYAKMSPEAIDPCEQMQLPVDCMSIFQLRDRYIQVSNERNAEKVAVGFFRRLLLHFRDEWGPKYCTSMEDSEGHICWFFTSEALGLIRSASVARDLVPGSTVSRASFITTDKIRILKQALMADI